MTSASNPKQKSRSSAEILAGKPRCIYCPNPADTVEHMPSKAMFREKHRPSGLEFPSCRACNNGTSAADSLVAFLARIKPFGDDVNDWMTKESAKYLLTAEALSPGVVREFFNDNNARDTLLRTPAGFLVPVAEMHTGPIAQALLHVFTAKLGMALYHEHVGSPLPFEGGVHCMWFMNNGLSEETATGMLKILPVHNTLRQGKRKSASGQFDYRYNSDDKSIVAALTHFHSNVHFFTLAMADPVTYQFPRSMPFSAFVRPGELLKFMPPKAPPAVLANPNWRPTPPPRFTLLKP